MCVCLYDVGLCDVRAGVQYLDIIMTILRKCIPFKWRYVSLFYASSGMCYMESVSLLHGVGWIIISYACFMRECFCTTGLNSHYFLEVLRPLYYEHVFVYVVWKIFSLLVLKRVVHDLFKTLIM